MTCSSLCLIVSLVVAFVLRVVWTEDDVIRGTYHAWWVILPIPTSAVRSMIEHINTLHDIVLMKPTWTTWPENKHPILMEIGRELDCGLVFPPWLRSNFLEYKFDIPFVQRKTGGDPLNYKAVLYEDSEINSISSGVAYKLNATKATMKMTNHSYTISKNGAKFSSQFSSNITWFTASAMPEFQVYKDVANLTWFGGRGLETCAQHHYDFGSARIRPAAVLSMTFTPSLLNNFFPDYRFRTNPLSGIDLFGSIEIVANFTMSLPHSCS
ncbi:uncharacterized protein LOC133183983 [Saccostrea echinata]|uniref:uncharacterized protein LOC133183983 n=1 Tax=Saccostrea echinata TaxID=191078 RepID=UPI002A7EF259|nr:uncharacterized protein LOC133183983 [Saccostrea echinata]